MKKIFCLLVLFLFPLLNPSAQDGRIAQLSGEGLFFIGTSRNSRFSEFSAPCRRDSTAAQHSIENATQNAVLQNDPCSNPLLLEFAARDTLNVEEMKIYSELLRQCEESKGVKRQYIGNGAVPTIKKYRNVGLLPLGIAGFAGSVYFFLKAKDQSLSMDLLDAFSAEKEREEMKKDMNASIFAGIGCLVAGVIFTIVALTPVEVRADGTELSLRYKFGL